MLKKTNILFLLIFLFFINNCGFTPQYAGFKGLDFSLDINNLDGDRDLNNALKSQLDRYSLGNPKLRKILLETMQQIQLIGLTCLLRRLKFCR